MGGLGLVVLASIGGVAALRGRSAVAPVPVPQPVAQKAEGVHQPLRVERGWLGVVIAEESVDLAARFEGRVESVRVRVGAHVRHGEVLALLDSQSARQELAVAEAELLSSRAELRMAALALEEAQERLKRRDSPEQLRTGAISQEEVSTARYQERMTAAKLEIARALVAEHEARVAQLRQRVTEASIRAPFDGIVASRFAHPGALLQPGQPLFHLLREGSMQVRFAVPSSQLQQVTVGQAVVLESAELARRLWGQVTQVSPEVDVASLMVFAIAAVEVPADVIVPAGTVVRVKVDSGEAHAGRESAAPLGSGSP